MFRRVADLTLEDVGVSFPTTHSSAARAAIVVPPPSRGSRAVIVASLSISRVRIRHMRHKEGGWR